MKWYWILLIGLAAFAAGGTATYFLCRKRRNAKSVANDVVALAKKSPEAYAAAMAKVNKDIQALPPEILDALNEQKGTAQDVSNFDDVEVS